MQAVRNTIPLPVRGTSLKKSKHLIWITPLVPPIVLWLLYDWSHGKNCIQFGGVTISSFLVPHYVCHLFMLMVT